MCVCVFTGLSLTMSMLSAQTLTILKDAAGVAGMPSFTSWFITLFLLYMNVLYYKICSTCLKSYKFDIFVIVNLISTTQLNFFWNLLFLPSLIHILTIFVFMGFFFWLVILGDDVYLVMTVWGGDKFNLAFLKWYDLDMNNKLELVYISFLFVSW